MIRSTEVLRDVLPCLFRLGDDLFERVQALFAAIVGCVIVVLTNDTAGVGEVCRGIKQNGARLFAVAARSTDFLRVGIDAERQTGVHDEPDIRAVDAETECVRRNDDRTLFREEIPVHTLFSALRELAVVRFRRVLLPAQVFRRALDIVDRRAVDDGRAVPGPVLPEHSVKHFEPLRALAALHIVFAVNVEFLYGNLNIRTFYGEKETFWFNHMQAARDIAEVRSGRRCRERKDLRRYAKRLDERADFGVGRAKTAVDLRQDVHLVHDNAAHPCGAERGADVLAAKLLGGKVQQAAVLHEVAQSRCVAALAEARVEEGGANALLLQRGDLVLLQGEQGRKNEGQLSRLVEESRELEKERFAAAGAEAHENVAVLENAGENLALFCAKPGHAELMHGGVYIIIIYVIHHYDLL